MPCMRLRPSLPLTTEWWDPGAETIVPCQRFLPSLADKCRLKHFIPFSFTNVFIFDARVQATAAILRKCQIHRHFSRLYRMQLRVLLLSTL